MNLKFPNSTLLKYTAFLLLIFLSNNAFSQLISISLEQRIDNANIVFEGKVIAKSSFWDASHNQIYTSNVISVYKVFKGNLTSSQVEIITQGGIVGRDMEQVSHSLQLNIGDVGVFTAIVNTVKFSENSSKLRLKAYAGMQGFIKYDLKHHSASDPFTLYKNISIDVYPAITRHTRSNIVLIQKADF